MLGVQGYDDVGETKEFFNHGKDGRDWFARIITRLIDNVLALKYPVWNYMPEIFLQMCEEIGHGVVDWFCGEIAYIYETSLLNCGYNMLYKGLLNSRHFAKETHFFGVRDAHAGINVGGFAVHDNEWTWVSWVEKGRVWVEQILRISDNYNKMAMSSSSEIGVDRFRVWLDLI